MTTARFRLAMLVGVVLWWGAGTAGTAQQDNTPGFGRLYADLSDEQRRLIDDLFARFSEVSGEPIDPSDGYDQFWWSNRTTFEAVTHALATTELTDADGTSLGPALDLVAQLETVAGRIEGAGSDQQFRIYARLTEDAVEVLERSREFDRDGDNIVYHRGYPNNFRQNGGTPSIQFSVSEKLIRADIDVDYRSARFPMALFNGHLTAANSDVRAGDNADRHNDRWEGFIAWWRGLFTLAARLDDVPEEGGSVLETRPRLDTRRIDLVVEDFLTAWLVEERPEVAVGYIARDAYECLALQPGEAEPFDYGMAPYRYRFTLGMVNDALGPRSSLREVVTGVRWTYPGLTRLEHDAQGEFVIFGVPDDIAEGWNCQNLVAGTEGEIPKVEPGGDYEDFEYFLSSFYIEGLAGGGGLNLLWRRQDDAWWIVAYESDPEPASIGALPDTRPVLEVDSRETIGAPSALLAAVESFTDSWLLSHDIDAAMGWLSPRILPCTVLVAEPEDGPLATDAARVARLRRGLTRTAEHLGEVDQLAEVIEGVDVWRHEFRPVRHDREDAYSVYGVPGWVGIDGGCERRVSGRPATPAADRTPDYGRYYVSAFRAESVTGEAVALLLAWVEEPAGWRAYSFTLTDP